MVPRRNRIANRDESFSVGDHTESWPQAPSSQNSPLSLSSPPALPFLPTPPELRSPVFGFQESTLQQSRHHRRTPSDLTYLTHATLDSQHRRASSTTSFTSHDGGHRFFCPEKGCSKSFERASDQKRHISQQHEGKSQMCTLCQRPYKRPYVHKTCRGRQSVFGPTQWQSSNNYGCGFCASYFSDFDKWVRHIQIHQKVEGKEKDDWDLSLELQSLLRNPGLASALAYEHSSISVVSLIWLEENYHEVKAILEAINHDSLDQLQIVFNLAIPLRNPAPDWPIPNYLIVSAYPDARDNLSLAIGHETEAVNSSTLPAAPGNFSWDRRDTSLQQTRQQTLRGIDMAIAGGGRDDSFDLTTVASGSQDVHHNYIGHSQKTEGEVRNGVFDESDCGDRSYFEDALTDYEPT